MFDYLQKFNSLPADLRARVSSPSAMDAINALEKKYKIDLAVLVMKVMAKSIAVKDLETYFISEYSLVPDTAEALVKDLKHQIFLPVADYLGLASEKRAFDLDTDIQSFIKEAGIVLPSSVLVSRFKNIIATYLRGVRNKIDTKNTLAKNVKIGGLGLGEAEISKILKLADQHEFVHHSAPQSGQKQSDSSKSSQPNQSSDKQSSVAVKKPPLSRIGQVANKHFPWDDVSAKEYNLKSALDAGQVKKLNISAPKEQLDLPPATQEELSGKKFSRQSDDNLGDKSDEHKVGIKDGEVEQKTGIGKPVLEKGHHRPASSLSPLKHEVLSDKSEKQTAPEGKARPKLEPVQPPKPSFWSKFKVNSRKVNKPVSSPKVDSAKKQEAIKPSQPKAPETVAAPHLQKNSVAAKTVEMKSVIPETQKAAVKVDASTVSRPAPSVAGSKPKLHDIKPMPKVMGPIEELKFLDLTNFRRLGSDPDQATAKILAKIKLLEKDGYDKMVAGVLAWRQSPVNKLYLRLGQSALNHDMTLKDLIAQHESDSNYLTWDEVQAIINLNGRLSF